MPDKHEKPAASTSDLTAAEFETERDRVCAEFEQKDTSYQPGQLTRVEYVAVGALLIAAYVLVLVLQ